MRTIEVDDELYEKIDRSRREGESLVEALRRLTERYSKPGSTAAILRGVKEQDAAGFYASEESLDLLEAVQREDLPPEDKWAS